MKKYQLKHTAKLRKKQYDLLGYLLLLFSGTIPLISYFLISKILNDFPLDFLNLNVPIEFLFVALFIFFTNTFLIWHFSPISLSKVQRIKCKLKKVIELNKFYYENKDLQKILSSMIIKFYWIDSNLYLEVYPNGASFTNKMNELTSIFETSLNLTVISVQSDYANHTTYVLTDASNNFIDSTNEWNV